MLEFVASFSNTQLGIMKLEDFTRNSIILIFFPRLEYFHMDEKYISKIL